MLLEFLNAILSLDLASLFSLLMNNLHWLFIFAALRHILSSGKSLLSGMLFLIFLLFSMRSIFHSLLNWQIIVLAFPLFFVAFGIFMLRIFLENTSLQKHVVSLTVLFIFVFTFLFNGLV
ncbi:MAG: hypothetical protein Q7S92_02925 [Candidatus Diapherotrites archaeon]|nr:hypothetical protein [Candidatus Diapherotrites archaeon]